VAEGDKLKKPRKTKNMTSANTPGCVRSGRRVMVDSKIVKKTKKAIWLI
jgi:hypothetical protein